MTTTAHPAPGLLHRGTPPVLVVAGTCVAVSVVATVVAGGLVAGSAGVLGALVGGSIALCFFMFGSLVVESATRMAPQTAIVVALMTYTLQVVLVAAAFALLTSTGAVGTTLSGGWIAGGVMVATVTWTLAQLVASARARIPAYDIDLPGSRESSSQQSFGPPPQPREVGAP